MTIGLAEIMMILIVAIVILNPKDWPKLIKKIGQMYGQFTRASVEFNHQLKQLGQLADSVSKIPEESVSRSEQHNEKTADSNKIENSDTFDTPKKST